MPGFGGHPTDANPLSDRDIVALGNYVLTHYGPGNTTITEQQVAEVRAGGPSSPLLALARGGWRPQRSSSFWASSFSSLEDASFFFGSSNGK